MPIAERIIIALFLCSNETNAILQELKPAWNGKVTASLTEKISLVEVDFLPASIFPWKEELSFGIEYGKFIASHLVQPDLFLRARPGKELVVKEKLSKGGVDVEIIDYTCIALQNASKIDDIIQLDEEAVVQDYSSQRVGGMLLIIKNNYPGEKVISVWDCCAASGGKSIMAKDILGDIELTVSDVRQGILHNLKKRFAVAGIKNYKSFVADLSSANGHMPASSYPLIIADVPCTGSGTWGRTPEQLYYFDVRKIENYVTLQQKIISTIVPHISAGGYLLYITCSVFKKENEEMVSFIKENFQLSVIKMELLKGYDRKADTMFAAILKKPLENGTG